MMRIKSEIIQIKTWKFLKHEKSPTFIFYLNTSLPVQLLMRFTVQQLIQGSASVQLPIQNLALNFN
jgi:hypothetical protein